MCLRAPSLEQQQVLSRLPSPPPSKSSAGTGELEGEAEQEMSASAQAQQVLSRLLSPRRRRPPSAAPRLVSWRAARCRNGARVHRRSRSLHGRQFRQPPGVR